MPTPRRAARSHPTATRRHCGRRCRFRPSRPASAWCRSPPRRTLSPFSRSATSTVAFGARFLVTKIGRSRSNVGMGWVVGGECLAKCRDAHGVGAEAHAGPEGDVHDPVDTSGLAELTCAVERVDDPHRSAPNRRRCSRPSSEHGVVRVMPGTPGRGTALRLCRQRPSHATSTLPPRTAALAQQELADQPRPFARRTDRRSPSRASSQF